MSVSIHVAFNHPSQKGRLSWLTYSFLYSDAIHRISVVQTISRGWILAI